MHQSADEHHHHDGPGPDAHHHGEPGDHHHHHHHHDHDHVDWGALFGRLKSPRVRRLLLGGIAVAALLWLVIGSLIFVDETELVYVTSFGSPARFHSDPGLKLKWPFQSVQRFDRRIQLVNPPGSQMLTGASRSELAGRRETLGGTPLTVEWYAGWKISPRAEDVLRFWKSVGTTTQARMRLRERIDALLKAEVGQMELGQFVSLAHSELGLTRLNQRLTERARSLALGDFGIHLSEVRIKRFNHPSGVRPAIYNMIRTERQNVADRYLAEGESEASRIRSHADLLVAQILAAADAEAIRIRGEGDAEAIRITNAAHRQDRELFELLNTLETYEAIFGERTQVVLSADSKLFRLLSEGIDALGSPRAAKETATPEDSH